MSTKSLLWTIGAVLAGMLIYKMVIEKYVLKSGFEGEVSMNSFDSDEYWLESNLKVV